MTETISNPVRVSVPRDLQEAVADVASRTGTHGFGVLLAAFLAQVYRRTLRQSLIVRTPEEAEDAALGIELAPDRTFADLLAEISHTPVHRRLAAGSGELAVRVTAQDVDVRFDAGETVDGWDLGIGPDGHAGAYLTLLTDAARRPHAAIGGLAMLGTAEAAAMARRINAAHDVYTGLRPLHAAFADIAAREPGLLAVVQGEEKITYGELDRRANGLAYRLIGMGIGTEATVGVLTRRSVDLVVALLGIWKAGAAYVPLDPRMPGERISVIADDARLSAVVTQDDFVDLIGDHGPAAVVVSEEETAQAPGVRVSLGDAAFIYYTSGSTGVPKGVVVDHRCAAGRLEWLARRYVLRPGDRVVHKTPLIFDVALWELVGPLSAGATIAMVDPDAESDVAHLGRLLSADRTVFAHFVPSMLSAYLNLAPAREYPALRWVQLSGEAMPAHLLERFTEHFQADFQSLYGQTETSEVAAWEGRSYCGGAHVPLGRQIGIYRLFVLDADLNPVPPGVPGELCVAGVGGLARGYHRRPGLTADRFVPHPYPIEPGERLYRTGDLATVAEDGVISFLGRLDDQTKIRGCRVETGEVEAVLAAHPAVTECAVVARPDDEGANQLAAYIVGDGVSAAELAAHLERRLPSYMLPAVYIAVESLPIGPSGKLDRNRLPAPSAEDRAARSTAEKPLGPVEEQLSEMWMNVLGIPRVGVSDNFFAVGGNSLKALQMLNRVGDAFGLEYSVREFFAGPTIAQMATSIEHSLTEMVAAMSDDEAAEFLGVLKAARS